MELELELECEQELEWELEWELELQPRKSREIRLDPSKSAFWAKMAFWAPNPFKSLYSEGVLGHFSKPENVVFAPGSPLYNSNF